MKEEGSQSNSWRERDTKIWLCLMERTWAQLKADGKI